MCNCVCHCVTRPTKGDDPDSIAIDQLPAVKIVDRTLIRGHFPKNLVRRPHVINIFFELNYHDSLAGQRLGSKSCGVWPLSPEPVRIPTMRLDNERVPSSRDKARWIIHAPLHFVAILSLENDVFHVREFEFC